MPYTPTPVMLNLSRQIIQAITEAQVILATRPSEKATGSLQILWKADSADALAEKLRPVLEAYIRAACTDPNILEETVLMMGVGHEAGHEPAAVMGRAIAAAMLLTFGIHPTYGDALALAQANAGEILTPEQRRTMEELERRGYHRRPLVRYGVMHKAGTGALTDHTAHVHPDGTFNID